MCVVLSRWLISSHSSSNSPFLHSPPPQQQQLLEKDAQEFLRLDQKLGLATGCVTVGLWKTAQELFRRLPPQYAASSPVLQQRMVDALHATIEPVYRSIAAPKVGRELNLAPIPITPLPPAIPPRLPPL